jgi:hypothetical protein
MSILIVFLNIVGVIVNVGKTQAAGFAVASLVVAIFAAGIISNFRNDPQNTPAYAILLSTASGLSGIIFLIIGLVS